MADINPKHGTWTALTWDMTSPASDTNLLDGRASTVVDNTDTFVDVMVGGTFTGPSSGAAAGVIQIFAYGNNRGTSNYTAAITGTDADFDCVDDEIKQLLRLVTVITTTTTNSDVYEWGPFSVAEVFGGNVPQKWGLFGVHDAGGALTASTTQYLGYEFQSA